MNFDRRILLRTAMEARKFSYAPFSGFHVGAALLSADSSLSSGSLISFIFIITVPHKISL